MLGTVPVMALLAVVFGRFIRKLSKQAQDFAAESNSIIEETLAGISNVKAFTFELFAIRNYQEKTQGMRNLNVKSGISLKKLYSELNKYPTKRTTVFLDACFSGGARNMPLLAARGVRINPKEETISGNIVVFSATSEKQSALSFDREKHGMFTYFLLKKDNR